MTTPVRVRFAPAPTGMMHLGNIRQALINLIFARQHNGSCILRIEDTDQQRMFDPSGTQIRADLAWLGIIFDEGPGIGGAYGPYIQSERTAIYQSHLHSLIQRDLVYRCFCTTEELERQRQRQVLLHQPPRYSRVCRTLSNTESSERAVAHPFVWRFKLNNEDVTISELVRGPVSFDLSNFADFPLTRQDGSFTFIFANAVDDISMKITHVFRGEDHLSNTASQSMIYRAFDAPLPIFWHTPIICNKDGKKLSKRDFGFSLDDLRTSGFLPEAIINYLACIGSSIEGKSEILTLQELIRQLNFAHHSSSSSIKYDVEKLKWVNHAWIQILPLAELEARCRPFLESAYGDIHTVSHEKLEKLIKIIRTELTVLSDIVPALHCYFHTPEISPDDPIFQQYTALKSILIDIARHLLLEADSATNFVIAQERIREQRAPKKEIYTLLRIILTGASEGTSISNLFHILSIEEIKKRIQRITDQ